MLDSQLGSPQSHDSLTVFPLLAGTPAELPYRLLTDALRAGTLRIGEVGSGTVPALLATNDGDADVLVLDGEQLIGARQNRMTNRSILLPARSKTEIPVSCMEQGRWDFTSDHMQPAPQHSPSKVRRRAREAEAEYALVGMAPPPEALAQIQDLVWDAIADTADHLGTHSSTGALDVVYAANADRLDEWARAFPAVEGQVGLLAFIREAPIGMDVIGGCGLYARLHDRLLRGYLIDALDRAVESTGHGFRSPDAAAAQRFLTAVREAGRIEAATVGRGVYRVLSGEVIGGELTDGDRLAHLSAFPAGPRGDTGAAGRASTRHEHPLPPPSRRRRHRPLD